MLLSTEDSMHYNLMITAPLFPIRTWGQSNKIDLDQLPRFILSQRGDLVKIVAGSELKFTYRYNGYQHIILTHSAVVPIICSILSLTNWSCPAAIYWRLHYAVSTFQNSSLSRYISILFISRQAKFPTHTHVTRWSFYYF